MESNSQNIDNLYDILHEKNKNGVVQSHDECASMLQSLSKCLDEPECNEILEFSELLISDTDTISIGKMTVLYKILNISKYEKYKVIVQQCINYLWSSIELPMLDNELINDENKKLLLEIFENLSNLIIN